MDEKGQKKEVMYSILELAEHGCFLDFVNNKPMNESLVRFYFRQLLSAIKCIHDSGYCHRDIKLENLLLDSHFNLQLSDFGFSTNTSKDGEKLFTMKGTLGYMAPEIF